MELAVSIVSGVVAIIAVIIAIWQAQISKSQLTLARDVEKRTTEALKEIRDISRDNQKSIDGIKKEIDDRVTKFIDTVTEDRRKSNEMSNTFAEEMMKGIFNQKP